MPEEQVSVLNPIGLTFTLCMGILLFLLPRRHALLPIALITCYMTFGQKIVLGGLDFTMLRVLVLFGLARIALRTEYHSLRWLRIDSLVLLWTITSITAYTLLWQTFDSLVNRLGYAYNAIGLYFLFRCLIRDRDDIKQACRLFAVVLFPLAICMCVERSTGRNTFYMFGGVPEFTRIREGTLRCQGPFAHPILAGTFGAVWFPLFVGLWWQGKGNRSLAALGILSSTLITITSGSSGPLATYLAGFLAILAGYIRPNMRVVRWAAVMLIISLQVMMREPIWFIFARVNFLSGSTGWHRSHLIDQTIKHFFDWWLVGIKDVGQWGIWATHGHGDVTNQYIRHGVDGGLISLLLFVSIIVWSFSNLGRSIKANRADSRHYKSLLWAVGSALFSHVVTFFSVAYFDQNVVNWYLLLAMIAGIVTMHSRNPQLGTLSTALEPSARFA
jgi:hypothetical protein